MLDSERNEECILQIILKLPIFMSIKNYPILEIRKEPSFILVQARNMNLTNTLFTKKNSQFAF